MAANTMLTNIKLLLGITDSSEDDKLELLIDMCTSEAKNYTHNDSIEGYDNVIEDMVIYSFNNLGSENLKSESYSGVKFDYRDDYPESILRQLRSHRKVVVI